MIVTSLDRRLTPAFDVPKNLPSGFEQTVSLKLEPVAKSITREQAQRKKAHIAEFMGRIGDPDRADEFDYMSVEEYAEHRGLRLTNPQRSTTMATSTGPTKADLQDQIDSAIETLEDAYTPEASREDLAEAVGSALDILNGDDEEEDIEEEEEDDAQCSD